MELTMDPFEVFPEEVWIQIFKNFKPSRDQSTIQSIYNSSPRFQPILHVHLMASALSVYHAYQRKHPHLYNLRTLRKDFLSLRLVSKSWKRVVDLLLQTHHYHTKTLRTSMKSLVHLPHVTLRPLREHSKLDILIESCSSIPQRQLGNHPFPSRLVQVNFGNISSPNYDFSKLQSLFGIIGNNVWYLAAVVEINQDSLDFRKLYHILQLLPNLKVIYFCINQIPATHPQVYQEPYLFPELKHLNTVIFYRSPGSFINDLLSVNRHVSKVVLPKLSTSVIGSLFVWKTGVICDELQLDVNYLMDLNLPGKVNWPVSKLNFVSSDYSGPVFSRGVLHKICEVTNLFKQTMTSCRLQLDWRHEIENEYLDLPMLTSLTVTFLGKINLNFILNLKNLKELTLKMRSMSRMGHWYTQFEGRDQLDIKSNLESLEDSMIWSKLPKLEKLTVKFCNFSMLHKAKNIFIYKRISKVRIARFQHWRKI